MDRITRGTVSDGLYLTVVALIPAKLDDHADEVALHDLATTDVLERIEMTSIKVEDSVCHIGLMTRDVTEALGTKHPIFQIVLRTRRYLDTVPGEGDLSGWENAAAVVVDELNRAGFSISSVAYDLVDAHTASTDDIPDRPLDPRLTFEEDD